MWDFTTLTGVLAVACGILLTFPDASCDEFSDENRPYEFGFNIEGQQHRHEKKDMKGIITGEFGFITADGVYHVTVYATDEYGDFKVLSMKNVRVSPPLDGSAPYNPSLKGNTGGSQQTTRKPVSILPSGEAPGNVVAYSSTTVLPVISTVKVFTGCSGCKVPVPNALPVIGNFSEPQPQKPFDLRDRSTTYSPILTQNDYFNTRPRINQPTSTTSYKISGVQDTTAVVPGGRNIISAVFNEAPFFSERVNSQSKEKISPQTINTNYVFPLLQPYDKLDQQTPFGDEQNRIPILPSVPYNLKLQPNPKTVYKEVFPPQENIPITAKQFNESPPTHLTVTTPYISSITKNKFVLNDLATPVRDDKNNTSIFRTVPQQNLLTRIDNTPIGIERNGPPPGFTEDDIKAILYKFNYTAGFHGHYESGYLNGNKIGGYYFNGRDGFGRNVQYVANKFGYQPNITLADLGLESDDIPKENTEKQFGLKGYEFKWFHRR